MDLNNNHDGFKLLILAIEQTADNGSGYEGENGGHLPLVLIDIDVPGVSGVDIVKQLKENQPRINYLMCTVFNDDENTYRSLLGETGGYILKSNSSKKIQEAFNELQAGNNALHTTIAKQMIGSFYRVREKSVSTQGLLTTRELEILRMLSNGLLCKEVASNLEVSVQTIRNHCANIYKKLAVNTKLEAMNIVFGGRRY